MTQWHKAIVRVVNSVERTFDALKARLDALPRGHRSAVIVPYRGYGSHRRIYIRGRVLANRLPSPSTANDSIFRNLLNSYRRMESDEVPGARVDVRFGKTETEAFTDEEGFFEVWIEVMDQPIAPGWQDIFFELESPQQKSLRPATAVGQVLIPDDNARIGIISDLDDTLVITHARNPIQMAYLTFVGNARTREPFAGVPAFYRALQRGGLAPSASNPLFFVSSSPWNLYDLLLEFFALHQIPAGPVFLRDWGVTEDEILPTDHRAHKLGVARQLLSFYEDLPFVLIGDSGQQDPEIYCQVVSEHPGRIPAIFIRDVSHDGTRTASVHRLADEVKELGCSLILASSTLDMASHAADRSWISHETLDAIANELERGIGSAATAEGE